MTGPGLVCVCGGGATQIEKLVNLNFKDVKSFLFRRAIQNAKQNLERSNATLGTPEKMFKYCRSVGPKAKSRNARPSLLIQKRIIFLSAKLHHKAMLNIVH